jgi:hypothetical protein
MNETYIDHIFIILFSNDIYIYNVYYHVITCYNIPVYFIHQRSRISEWFWPVWNPPGLRSTRAKKKNGHRGGTNPSRWPRPCAVWGNRLDPTTGGPARGEPARGSKGSAVIRSRRSYDLFMETDSEFGLEFLFFFKGPGLQQFQQYQYVAPLTFRGSSARIAHFIHWYGEQMEKVSKLGTPKSSGWVIIMFLLKLPYIGA